MPIHPTAIVDKKARIGKDVEIGPYCVVEGDVEIGENSSIWSKAVIRADGSWIKIGKNTNIQDMCVIHTEFNIPIEIGDNVTIGHSAVIHCRKIASNCVIGMGALLLDNVEIGEYSVIGAGAVVAENKIIPPRSLVAGVPGRVIKKIKDEHILRISKAAESYLCLAKAHYERTHQTFD